MLKFVHGKKTYVVAAASVIYAVAGYYTGHVNAEEMVRLIQAAVMGACIRHGVSAKPGETP